MNEQLEIKRDIRATLIVAGIALAAWAMLVTSTWLQVEPIVRDIL